MVNGKGKKDVNWLTFLGIGLMGLLSVVLLLTLNVKGVPEIEFDPSEDAFEKDDDLWHRMYDDEKKITITIEAAETDPESSIEKVQYRWDDTVWKDYLEPLNLTSLTAGDHKLEACAENSTNVTRCEYYNFTLDSIPPENVEFEFLTGHRNVDGKDYVLKDSSFKFFGYIYDVD